MKQIKIFLILTFLSSVGFSQTPSSYSGTASNLFLRFGLSTRVSALGETFTAIADDENALYYNPAGLANIKKGALGMNHTEWFQDIRMDNLVFGYNLDKNLGLAFSVSHMWMPGITGKDNFGNATNEINVSSSIMHLGLGYKIHPSLFLGLAVKYFNHDLAGYSANGIAMDAGFYMYTFLRGLTVGLAVQNFGGDIEYDVAQEKIPLTLRAGIAYKVYGAGLRIAVDAVKSVDSNISLATAMEYTMLKTLSLRLGNKFSEQQAFLPSFGAGVNIKQDYAIDYTFYSANNLGNTHKVGFTFRFNTPQSVTESAKYKRGPVLKSRAPGKIIHKFAETKLQLHWERIPEANYNIYAKTSVNGSWKKINRKSLKQNRFEFLKPGSMKSIYFCVTSVINNVESNFSKEVKIDF